MSQNNSDQGQTAEPPTQETKTFIRQVRSATRRKYAPEDKIRIVLEGFRREVTVSDLCRREGILIKRREVKSQTLANRKRYNRQRRESYNTATSP